MVPSAMVTDCLHDRIAMIANTKNPIIAGTLKPPRIKSDVFEWTCPRSNARAKLESEAAVKTNPNSCIDLRCLKITVLT